MKGERYTTLGKGRKDLGTGKTQSTSVVQAALVDIGSLRSKRGKRKWSGTSVHINIYRRAAKRERVTGTSREPHPAGTARPDGQRPSPSEWQRQIIRREQARLNHTTGRQRPPVSGQASRDPHPGRQRPSPSRVPTRTSRRAGIGQGDLPHTKVTTSSLRMQGDRKEQHSSHSLNQWKERFDLWHRHAGMLTREWTPQIERHP